MDNLTELIELNEDKMKEHNDLIKECKQELKEVRIRISRITSELNGELSEEKQLEARLNRLSLQKSFLSGLVEGLEKRVEGN